jgi:hypothetical protein
MRHLDLHLADTIFGASPLGGVGQLISQIGRSAQNG